MKDLFNRETLCRACSFLPADRVFFQEVCNSTNAAAKAWLARGNKGSALFAAAAQTAGRGRMGRSFFSPAGSGVYFTLVQTMGLKNAAGGIVGVTCAAAVAVLRAIRALCGVECEIKWVNDLLYRGKKVCGILTETVTEGDQTAILVGVGVNLRSAKFPPELTTAGSLEDEHTPRAELIANVAERLLACFTDPDPAAWLSEYRRHSCVLGRRVVFWKAGEPIEATALAIEADGGLRVETGQGIEVLRTGEITLRLI